MLRNAKITRVRQSGGSQTLKQSIDGTTIPYSGPNLTTMLSGVTNPSMFLRVDNNGNPDPFM